MTRVTTLRTFLCGILSIFIALSPAACFKSQQQKVDVLSEEPEEKGLFWPHQWDEAIAKFQRNEVVCDARQVRKRQESHLMELMIRKGAAFVLRGVICALLPVAVITAGDAFFSASADRISQGEVQVSQTVEVGVKSLALLFDLLHSYLGVPMIFAFTYGQKKLKKPVDHFLTDFNLRWNIMRNEYEGIIDNLSAHPEVFQSELSALKSWFEFGRALLIEYARSHPDRQNFPGHQSLHVLSQDTDNLPMTADQLKKLINEEGRFVVAFDRTDKEEAAHFVMTIYSRSSRVKLATYTLQLNAQNQVHSYSVDYADDLRFAEAAFLQDQAVTQLAEKVFGRLISKSFGYTTQKDKESKEVLTFFDNVVSTIPDEDLIQEKVPDPKALPPSITEPFTFTVEESPVEVDFVEIKDN